MDHHQGQIDATLDRVAQQVRTQIEERALVMEALARDVASLDAVQAATAADDHDALIALLAPVADALKAAHGLSQMHVQTAEVTSLARLHKHEKWGDDLTT